MVNKDDIVRFKTWKNIEQDVCHNNPAIRFHIHRGPYIYTTKIFKVVEIYANGKMCVIENVLSHKRHKVYRLALRKIGE